MISLCRAIALNGERIQKLQFLSVVSTNVARLSQLEHSSARFCFRTLLVELNYGKFLFQIELCYGHILAVEGRLKKSCIHTGV